MGKEVGHCLLYEGSGGGGGGGGSLQGKSKDAWDALGEESHGIEIKRIRMLELGARR